MNILGCAEVFLFVTMSPINNILQNSLKNYQINRVYLLEIVTIFEEFTRCVCPTQKTISRVIGSRILEWSQRRTELGTVNSKK